MAHSLPLHYAAYSVKPSSPSLENLLKKNGVDGHVRLVIEEGRMAQLEMYMPRRNISMARLKMMDTRKVLESGWKMTLAIEPNISNSGGI